MPVRVDSSTRKAADRDPLTGLQADMASQKLANMMNVDERAGCVVVRWDVRRLVWPATPANSTAL